ncbi:MULTISPECIES: hypothetical protein [Paraburkholderia]|uniref:Uncharacterized protein n=2 Tax=Burkholderiaceae TaxID=119060 RepID=A0AAP5BLZ0_9BURK|nr:MULTISPECIES: hypothetical protein [Paraburkholderia]MCX4151016.1 hypothetical protein [Paraburkholderia madseniana]MDN7153948.1 hypothetical protein [Paraburkholderia sp. WS6]MDQ6412830.1 hypothetical protein [Paraburkholderia madseniana]
MRECCTHDDTDSIEVDQDINSPESLEQWMAGATREELMQRIRDSASREMSQEEAFLPAVKWLSGRLGNASDHYREIHGVTSELDLIDPCSIVQVLLELAQQGARVSASDGEVMQFLSDYRPDLVAQLIAYRRHCFTRLTNDWPEAARAEHLRNTLVDRINCAVRTGYAHLPSIQYWAGLLEVYSPHQFDILAEHESIERDTGETEFAEGRSCGLAGIFPESPYNRQSFKDAMWWQGHLKGSNERRWKQLIGKPNITAE